MGVGVCFRRRVSPLMEGIVLRLKDVCWIATGVGGGGGCRVGVGEEGRERGGLGEGERRMVGEEGREKGKGRGKRVGREGEKRRGEN